MLRADADISLRFCKEDTYVQISDSKCKYDILSASMARMWAGPYTDTLTDATSLSHVYLLQIVQKA